MVSARLLGILKSFSHEEVKAFEKFLLSPFFNTNKNYIKYYKELLEFHPDFSSDKLTSEFIFSKMFSDKRFSKQVMWNLSSGLEKLAEEFLTHWALVNKPQDKFNLLVDELRMRLLGKHFHKKLKEWEKLNENNKVDLEQLYYSECLEGNKVAYWQQLKGIRGKQPEANYNMSQIHTLYSLIIESRIINSLNTSRVFEGFDKPSSMSEDLMRNLDFERFVETCKRNKYKYADLIEFYYNMIYCNLSPQDEKHFYKAKKFLFKNHKLFSIKEKKDLASKLANYCTFKNMVGATQFRKELFSINEFRLKENIAVYANGKIGKSLFKQIVSNAASLKQIRWAEKFVEYYTPLLFEDYQDSMKSLARAYIYFNSGKYEQVLESINKFNSADVADKMQVKNLIARTHYEMREFELLLYHIDATMHFLKKNKKISDYFREVNGKFLNYLHNIAAAIEKKDLDRLNALEADIKKDNRVNNKLWLLEKLEELKST